MSVNFPLHWSLQPEPLLKRKDPIFCQISICTEMAIILHRGNHRDPEMQSNSLLCIFVFIRMEDGKFFVNLICDVIDFRRRGEA